MDTTDVRITDILKRNARISFQELGDRIGLSRVAAKKRVRKLEEEGIIRGYNTCIYRDDEITMLIDIVTTPGGFEEVLKYVCTRTAYIRQIFRTTKENHIHYDQNGQKTGETRRGFFGGFNHYDENGRKTGHSDPSIFGGWNDYNN